MLEREIKLRFESVDEAREAVRMLGATPLRGRRLQEDCLLDSPDGSLRARRTALRIRMESGRSLLTFKGPVQPSAMKLREELETVVGDGTLILRIFEELGFQVWFRYEKYREEFAREGVIVAIDETPIGIFVELEGSEQAITEAATLLGRSSADYVADSYRRLFAETCRARGVEPTDMLFDDV
ncbi:MAG TPA: class IV adenylate cyclase [Vicinamibacterales bacterium]|jgi:adenylate cyclase class 2